MESATSCNWERFCSQLPLRDYQKRCLEAIEDRYRAGIRRQLVSMATGAGKTVIFAHLINHVERPTLVLVYTTELLEQAKEKIVMVCPRLEVGLNCNWSQDEFTQGVNGFNLCIHKSNVIDGKAKMASRLSFNYVFGVAKDFTRETKSRFLLLDRCASCRNEPITPKQLQISRSGGYRKRVELLTRGQASDLIACGCLRRER